MWHLALQKQTSLRATFQDTLFNNGGYQYLDKEPFRKSRDEFQTELHTKSGCYYKKLFGWRIVGTSVKLTILIRVCDCRRQTNREGYLKNTVINLSEYGDGLEARFDERCRFQEPELHDGIREFRKVCYCPRPQLSMLH